MERQKEILKWLQEYLNDVNTIMQLFKSLVGDAKPGKSWIANIPDKGSYPEVEINSFYRHGVGIRVDYQGKDIDFDFSDLDFVFEDDESRRIMKIDIWFFFQYLDSLSLGFKADKNILEKEVEELVKKGVLTKKSICGYYFTQDIVDM